MINTKVFAALLLIPGVVCADVQLRKVPEYEAAVRLYQAGKIELAIKILEQCTKKGDPKCQAALGTHYYLGDGIKEDINKAVDLLTKSSEKNIPMANSMLGMMYHRGHGVKQDEEKAYSYALKAAYACIPTSQDQVAYALYEGVGVEKNRPEALAWLYVAVDSGNEESTKGVLQLERELSVAELAGAKEKYKEFLSQQKCDF